MAEIRRLKGAEIKQAEVLSAALADCVADVAERENINNIGVVSAAILVLLSSVVIEFLDEDERKLAAGVFSEQLMECLAMEASGSAPNMVN